MCMLCLLLFCCRRGRLHTLFLLSFPCLHVLTGHLPLITHTPYHSPPPCLTPPPPSPATAASLGAIKAVVGAMSFLHGEFLNVPTALLSRLVLGDPAFAAQFVQFGGMSVVPSLLDAPGGVPSSIVVEALLIVSQLARISKDFYPVIAEVPCVSCGVRLPTAWPVDCCRRLEWVGRLPPDPNHRFYPRALIRIPLSRSLPHPAQFFHPLIGRRSSTQRL